MAEVLRTRIGQRSRQIQKGILVRIFRRHKEKKKEWLILKYKTFTILQHLLEPSIGQRDYINILRIIVSGTTGRKYFGF